MFANVDSINSNAADTKIVVSESVWCIFNGIALRKGHPVSSTPVLTSPAATKAVRDGGSRTNALPHRSQHRRPGIRELRDCRLP